MKPNLIPLVLASLIAGAANPLHAQNRLSNGGFETGDFTGWTLNSTDASLVIDASGDSGLNSYIQAFQSTPDGGNFYALFTSSSVTSTLDQSFATTSGETYLVDFWLNDTYGNASLTVAAGATTLFNLSSTDASLQNQGWVLEEKSFVAAGPTTDLMFSGNTASSFLGVDAVTVVPEPGTLALGFAALGFVGFRCWRRACSIQRLS
jgi:hypothetical protein